MSDKTLVEMLRNESRCSTCLPVCLENILGIEFECHEMECSECHSKAYNALADAIECEYLPRPRYEDGEHVQFGDIYTDKCGREWKNGIKSIHIDCNGDFSLHDNTIGHVGRYEVFGQDRRVKRHKPDSLERIEEDAGKSVCEYFGRKIGDCENCKGFGGCMEKMLRDLLRRQREILENK